MLKILCLSANRSLHHQSFNHNYNLRDSKAKTELKIYTSKVFLGRTPSFLYNFPVRIAAHLIHSLRCHSWPHPYIWVGSSSTELYYLVLAVSSCGWSKFKDDLMITKSHDSQLAHAHRHILICMTLRLRSLYSAVANRYTYTHCVLHTILQRHYAFSTMQCFLSITRFGNYYWGQCLLLAW